MEKEMLPTCCEEHKEQFRERLELTERVRKGLEGETELNDREKRVLTMRFGLEDGVNRSLGEVGTEFKCTREHIRQIEVKALVKLDLLKARG